MRKIKLQLGGEDVIGGDLPEWPKGVSLFCKIINEGEMGFWLISVGSSFQLSTNYDRSLKVEVARILPSIEDRAADITVELKMYAEDFDISYFLDAQNGWKTEL